MHNAIALYRHEKRRQVRRNAKLIREARAAYLPCWRTACRAGAKASRANGRSND